MQQYLHVAFTRETSLNLALQSEHVNSKEPRLVTFIYNKSGSVALFLTGLCTLYTILLHTTLYLHTLYTLSTHHLHMIYYLHTIY